ncbi:hypothetical protein VPH49_22025 [Pseudomonas luteola]|uniref:hypothetical protein n=1 Tax=Pseudomonas luteola TaxID=47886 RepID=UPI003A84F1A0
MLKIVDNPSTGGTGKQVNFSTTTSTTSGTVLYTVPVGKTCKGVFSCIASGGATANAVSVIINMGTLHVPSPLEVTLVAGTVIKSNATGTLSFCGVEQ